MSCETETPKELIKKKTESGNCFCIRVVKSIKRRLIVMSTNAEYRERERQRKRENRRHRASEAQRQKERQIRSHFLLEEQNEFVAAVGK